jgi:N-acetylneuraminate synthase
METKMNALLAKTDHLASSFKKMMEDSGVDFVAEEFKTLEKKVMRAMITDEGVRADGRKPEEVTIDFAFSTLVSIKEINKGDILSEENIWVKRPGTGNILAKHFQSIIGKKSKIDMPKDHHLNWTDFE